MIYSPNRIGIFTTHKRRFHGIAFVNGHSIMFCEIEAEYLERFVAKATFGFNLSLTVDKLADTIRWVHEYTRAKWNVKIEFSEQPYGKVTAHFSFSSGEAATLFKLFWF